jgi:hypothetical protein
MDNWTIEQLVRRAESAENELQVAHDSIERDLFNAFLAGYDAGHDDAKDDNYATTPILRETFRRMRSYYNLPLDDGEV